MKLTSLVFIADNCRLVYYFQKSAGKCKDLPEKKEKPCTERHMAITAVRASAFADALTAVMMKEERKLNIDYSMHTASAELAMSR